MPSRDDGSSPGSARAAEEPSTSVEDRRKHPRREFPPGEVISTARHENGEFFEGHVRDLSEGGLRIEGQLQGVEVGAELMVSIVLPSYAQQTFRCTVGRVETGGHYWAAQILD